MVDAAEQLYDGVHHSGLLEDLDAVMMRAEPASFMDFGESCGMELSLNR
jgi:hypothetical protein